MESFLKYVAKDILAKYGNQLAHIAVVFPNKRAALFLNQELATIAGKPIWSPAYITISELFRRHADVQVADDIRLVCQLHQVFNQCTNKDESLDDFYGWGQLMLADFDDVDKNMADADKVFANLKNLHELDDSSYLTEEQKEILKKFFKNFSEDHQTILKERFLQLWSHFDDIYHSFNRKLSEQGLAYEGALYRRVIEQEDLHFQYDMYLFVGFNMMQKVEMRLMDKLQKQGKAKFYWDFDHYYMSDGNEAGHYIKSLLNYYPNELPNDDDKIYNCFKTSKNITYYSAPTETVQARFVTQWLKEYGRIEAGQRTAIVMADESLLPTILHSLPPEVNHVNVTTGYPLAQSPVASLVALLLKLQTAGHPKNSSSYRLKYVKQVLRHPYMKYLSEKYQELLADLEEHKRFYPSRESLSIDDGLALLFADINQLLDTNKVADSNLALCVWMLQLLKRIAQNGGAAAGPFFQESIFRMYTLINRLLELINSNELKVNLSTFERLFSQLLQNTTIPFHGEPVVGIQIMGVLETRNLDFDHVLLLSCNEGNLPKGVNDASFIPYSIRKAYDLTTIDNKVAIYAYYFHSLLQRASDIAISYNNATEGTHTGEMSRFMLQLMVESRHLIKQKNLIAKLEPIQHQRPCVYKDKAIMKVLSNMDTLSPTAINTYIRCQLRFYFRYVAGIHEPDQLDEDEIDNRVFGNIFHKSAQNIYLSMAPADAIDYQNADAPLLLHPISIERLHIEKILKQEALLQRIVDEAFKEELFKVSTTGYLPEYNGLQLINRAVIINYLKQLLKTDRRLAPFRILGLELPIEQTFMINGHSIKIAGYIDRLDEVTDQQKRIRVIDYKTGKAPTKPITQLEEVFSGNNLREKHSDYYLQAMLYALMVRQQERLNPEKEPVSPALLFIQHTTGQDYDPTLEIGHDRIVDVACYGDEFYEQLQQVLAEILSPDVPFNGTNDKTHCTSCPFAQLCLL